ncbi:hypothetical protein KSD_47880 [Ktedonobacter sp. SOSP1-85]|uniref:site-specific integrase n=1 Tax=Ktedonobacter sp. SOSP1-85 TaxID=2778367 RepID=UPI00191666AC|nr:tyrosine-type recombinase/integrase [Ktedonobacter sp. SOSP1-85]GHO77017.1 hypothetical protein KSD_47880 [Ktedonobacter sp. SOSP1-85]
MGRKPHYGEGSVFERKDGRWEAIVPNFSGTGKRKSFYGKTKTEARKKRDEALAKLARGEYVDVSKMKIGEYLEYWLENHAATVKLTSTQLYRSMIKVHCIPHLEHIPLQKLTTQDVQHMCTEMSKQGLAPRTVDKAHTVLSQALSDAVDLGKIAKNPCLHVKLPRAEKREPIILDEEQARRLIQAAREAQSEKRYIGTIVLLLISTGMRIGELLALHWSQIDFEKKELRIAATVSYDQTARILLETGPKSDTSHRTLPLPKNVFAKENLASQFGESSQHESTESHMDECLAGIAATLKVA